MTLLGLLAVAFFILALVCLLVPTTVLSEGWPLWTVAGLLADALDRRGYGGVVFAGRRSTTVAAPPQ
jgi:hypothetical protein